jgi:transcriptional regulator of arginine metabolism
VTSHPARFAPSIARLDSRQSDLSEFLSERTVALLFISVVYLFKRGRRTSEPRFRFVRNPADCPEQDICLNIRPNRLENAMKLQRHNAIRDLLTSSLVTNQDELRRKLRRRGFAVTQATLSRDIHELRLSKGPGGYSFPNGNSANGHAAVAEDDSPPSVEEMIESFGMRVRRAMNQVVVGTVMGGAQPFAAALDHAGWSQVVGTIAGDDTVLIICPDVRNAGLVEARIRALLES